MRLLLNSDKIRFNKQQSNNGINTNIAVIDCDIFSYNRGKRPKYKEVYIQEKSIENHHANVIYDIIWNNSYGIANKANLYHYAVTDKHGRSSLNDINSAIRSCIKHNVDIINLSLMYLDNNINYLDVTMSMFTNKGGVIVASSGNQNLNKVKYPSIRQDVISVGDYDYGNERSGEIGNTGHSLDITAPCDNIFLPQKYKDNEQEYRGTSFGSAYVTGVIAQVISLLKEHKVNYNHYTIREILDSAKVKSSLYVGKYGYLDYGNVMKATYKYIEKEVGQNVIKRHN